MGALDIQGAVRGKPKRTTIRDQSAAPLPDLVDREAAAEGPDECWVADLT